MKTLKKLIINIIPYVATIVVFILLLVVTFEISKNRNDEILSGRDIQKLVIDDCMYNGDNLGFHVTDDPNIQLGYINIKSDRNNVLTLDDNGCLVLYNEFEFLWKIRFYTEDLNTEWWMKKQFSEKPITSQIKKNEHGSYIELELIGLRNTSSPIYLNPSSLIRITRIELFYEEPGDFLDYKFELNASKDAYKIIDAPSEFLIIPDYYKGLPVNDYDLDIFVFAEFIKIGSNIKTIYSNSFGSYINYVEFPSIGSVETIERYAFDSIYSLEYIYIPKYIKNIHSEFVNAYTHGPIVKIFFEEDSIIKTEFKSYHITNVSKEDLINVDGVTYQVIGKEAKVVDIDNDKEKITIPSIIPNTDISVTSIGKYIICGNEYSNEEKIEELILPDGLKSIDQIFYNEYSDSKFEMSYNIYNGGYYLGTPSNPYCYLAYGSFDLNLLHNDIEYIDPNVTYQCSATIEENQIQYLGTSENPYLICIKIGDSHYSSSSTVYTINPSTEYMFTKGYLSRGGHVVLPDNLKKIYDSSASNWSGSNISFELISENPNYKTYKGSLYETLEDGYGLIIGSKQSIIDGTFNFINNCKYIYNNSISRVSIDYLILPEGLVEIGSNAFYYNYIDNIYISSTVEKIGDLLDNENYYKNIDFLTVSPDNKFYKIKDGMLVSYDETTLYYAIENIDFYVPEYVTKIEKYSISARNVFIHKNVEHISSYMLRYNDSYTADSFAFLFGDIKIGYEYNWDSYFASVYSNAKVVKHKGIIYVITDDTYAKAVSFYDYSKENYNKPIELVENVAYDGVYYIVNEIGYSAFYGYGSINLPEIIIIPSTITIIGSYSFFSSSSNNIFYIPSTVINIGHQAIRRGKVYCQVEERPSTWNESFLYSGTPYYGYDSIPES